ncbi:ABC transporter permease [Nocardioides sp. MAHUQ-72]|uniref:ABC transporter permease n=1 Tax=unclassified Nocardioides TaxID=2615069 RepID=UPI003613906F
MTANPHSPGPGGRAAEPAEPDEQHEKPPSRLAPALRFTRQILRMPTGLVGVVVMVGFILMALLAPLFIHPSDLSVTEANGPLLGPPQAGYPLGTDPAGRSVLDLVIWGSRTSIAIGLMATALTMVLGAGIGLVAGHYGGRVGRGLMHVTDWFIALPSLPLAIALAAVLGQGTASITIAIGVTSWTGTARLVRAQTLAVEARPFIERARALGATDAQLMTRQVLPNVMPLILVSSTLTVASAILAEATLTFLGLGDPTAVSWGSLINNAFMQGAVTAGAWWYLLPPGLAILVIVLGFTLVGRAVEHLLNARVQAR